MERDITPHSPDVLKTAAIAAVVAYMEEEAQGLSAVPKAFCRWLTEGRKAAMEARNLPWRRRDLRRWDMGRKPWQLR